MGATFSSIQVRADSQESVINSLDGLLKEPTYVSPAVGGWVGVYPEGAAATDTLAAALSHRLSTAVLDWSVYDSDVFTYSLYESGELHDEFNSSPHYFEGMGAAGEEEGEPGRIDPARVQGDPQALLPYCLPGTTPAAISEVLHPAELTEPRGSTAAQTPGFPEAVLQKLAETLGTTADALKQGVEQKMREKYVFAEHQAADLARLLGMDEGLASAGFRYIEQADIHKHSRESFHLVGSENLSQKYKDSKLWQIECLQDPERLSHWLQQGADPNTRDQSGQPVLFRYVPFPQHVAVLLAAGADVNILSTRSPHLDPEFPEIYGQYEAGVTALMVAARLTDGESGRVVKVARTLLDVGADVNARSETGRTALGEALKMSDPAQHQGRLGRQVPQSALEQDAAANAQVAEMLRAAGVME